MSKPLPPAPNLRHLRREAKSLLKSHRKRDPKTAERLRVLHRFSKSPVDEILGSPVTLAEAQFVVALEYGFKSWSDLKSQIEPAGETAMIMKSIEDNLHFAFLGIVRRMEFRHVAELVEKIPNGAASVLVLYPKNEAAKHLAKLPPAKQAEVIADIASLDRPRCLIALGRVAAKLASEAGNLGGVNVAAELLNLVDRPTEKAILAKLEKSKPKLASTIKNLVFVFEDVVRIDDKGIQDILRETEPRALALALKSTGPEVQRRFLGNMSAKASEMIREEMAQLGPVKVREIEAAQQGIVDTVARFEKAGKIEIGRKAGGVA